MHKLISLHKTGFCLLQKIHAVDSCILPLHMLEVFLSVAKVYINLFLTAKFIDLLLAQNFRLAGITILWLLLADLFLDISIQLMKRKFRGMKTKVWLLFYVWMREKAFSLDYETMERPEVAERILYSERTADMHGGLGVLLYHYCEILRAILHILLSVFWVISLCMAAPMAETGLLSAITSPLPSALFFSLVLTGMSLCTFWIFQQYAKQQTEIFQSHTGVENKLSYFTNQIYGSAKTAKTIRIYGMEDMIFENTMINHSQSKAYFKKMCEVSIRENNAGEIVNSLFTIAAYFLAAAKTVAGAISIGNFTRYTGALNQFGNACFSIISSHRELRKICTYMDEFLAFLNTENLHSGGSIPVEKRDDGEYELAFEHVSFHYPGSENLVLKDVNCKFRIKGKLAVVGKNGAGKTTFIKLLCRLYEPTAGRITLNGIDIKKYSEEEYRSLFSVVFQDFKLFALPVWENITAGFVSSRDEIWEALRQADADKLVKSMPNGLDTYLYKNVESGIEISGGEAQKLSLARALYKDAPVIILDEPTAALDPKTEADIYARFNKMVEAKTSIYISHRMSSCQFCDEIIVFENGTIVERGSHEELLSAGADYSRMWNAQAKYYIS